MLFREFHRFGPNLAITGYCLQLKAYCSSSNWYLKQLISLVKKNNTINTKD